MGYTIRPFDHADAPALANITLAAIRAVGSARYSPQQVNAWVARHPAPERFTTRAKNGARIFIAAAQDDQPVAYSLLEPDGHLDMLYCHPDHTRRGLADLLLRAAEGYARTAAMKYLFTEASELARPAFERAGYVVLHRRDFDIELDGKPVPIHNYAMEKPLIYAAHAN